MNGIDKTTAKIPILLSMFGTSRGVEILNALAGEMEAAGGKNWTPEKRAEWFDRAFRERYGI
jgi:hypothetical protein